MILPPKGDHYQCFVVYSSHFISGHIFFWYKNGIILQCPFLSSLPSLYYWSWSLCVSLVSWLCQQRGPEEHLSYAEKGISLPGACEVFWWGSQISQWEAQQLPVDQLGLLMPCSEPACPWPSRFSYGLPTSNLPTPLGEFLCHWQAALTDQPWPMPSDKSPRRQRAVCPCGSHRSSHKVWLSALALG